MAAARRAQSAYSGATLTTRPPSRPSLTRTLPPGSDTVITRRSSIHLRTGIPRTPRVEVSRHSSSRTAASVPGVQSTDRVMPGRPFFMWIGVNQTSAAPASNSRSSTQGASSGVMSSRLASSTRPPSPAAPSSVRSPTSTRSRLGSSSCWRVPAP